MTAAEPQNAETAEPKSIRQANTSASICDIALPELTSQVEVVAYAAKPTYQKSKRRYLFVLDRHALNLRNWRHRKNITVWLLAPAEVIRSLDNTWGNLACGKANKFQPKSTALGRRMTCIAEFDEEIWKKIWKAMKDRKEPLEFGVYGHKVIDAEAVP